VQIAFSTENIHPRDRFDYWHDCACAAYAPFECHTDDRPRFAGQIEMAPLGHTILSTYSNTELTLDRDRAQIARDQQDRVFLCLQLSGTCHIRQDGRDAALEPGDFCVVTTVRPYFAVYPANSNQLVLTIATADLTARIGELRRLTAMRVQNANGASRLASRFIQMLPGVQGELSGPAALQIANQAIDLAALALSERAALAGIRLSSTAILALHRLKIAVDAHLSNPNARCAEIAEAAGISVRYANLLLGKEGTSLERHLRARRLERCREALLDPRQAERSTSEIGYAWGFKDAGHFARTFKAAYGLPPGEFRNAARR